MEDKIKKNKFLLLNYMLNLMMHYFLMKEVHSVTLLTTIEIDANTNVFLCAYTHTHTTWFAKLVSSLVS